MKGIWGGRVVAAAVPGSAFAADLPSRSYAKAPAMAAPATNWSGLYIGGNVGYGWGTGGPDVALLPSSGLYVFLPTFGGCPQSPRGGAQKGFKLQTGPICYWS